MSHHLELFGLSSFFMLLCALGGICLGLAAQMSCDISGNTKCCMTVQVLCSFWYAKYRRTFEILTAPPFVSYGVQGV